jgi:hypothetical protein
VANEISSVVWVGTRVGWRAAVEAPNHESRAGEEHDGERDLGDHERAASQATAPRRGDSRSILEDVLRW